MRELKTVLTTVIERLPVPVNDLMTSMKMGNLRTPHTQYFRGNLFQIEPKKISSGRRKDWQTQRGV